MLLPSVVKELAAETRNGDGPRSPIRERREERGEGEDPSPTYSGRIRIVLGTELKPGHEINAKEATPRRDAGVYIYRGGVHLVYEGR